VITLTLLHPIQSIPVQSWTFEQESVIRIGRSTDNHVILYSAVVSRHHVELRRVDGHWEIINLGANGTYLDGKRITQVPVTDGVIVRLARSGPNIQIHIGSSGLDASQALAGDRTLAQAGLSKPVEPSSADVPTIGSASKGMHQHLQPDSIPLQVTSQPNMGDDIPSQPLGLETSPGDSSPLSTPSPSASKDQPSSTENIVVELPEHAVRCSHPRARPDLLFCPDCGQPLHILQVVGHYQVMKTLSQTTVDITQLAWRDGQTLLLKTLQPDWVSAIAEPFGQRARRLIELRHPALPRYVDFFVEAGQSYLVQERVYGQDLGQQIANQGSLSPQAAIALMLQVCDVLDYLHQQTPPFLHLDLKPEYLIRRSTSETTPSLILGGLVTPVGLMAVSELPFDGYHAPELSERPTIACDLFAIGPLLVYLTTGEDPKAFYAQREQGFRFYPEYVPGVPPALAVVIRRLTSPKPEERYSTAKETAEALRQVLPEAEKL